MAASLCFLAGLRCPGLHTPPNILHIAGIVTGAPSMTPAIVRMLEFPGIENDSVLPSYQSMWWKHLDDWDAGHSHQLECLADALRAFEADHAKMPMPPATQIEVVDPVDTDPNLETLGRTKGILFEIRQRIKDTMGTLIVEIDEIRAQLEAESQLPLETPEETIRRARKKVKEKEMGQWLDLMERNN